MRRWERKFVIYSGWKKALDLVRWMIILGVWGFVFYKLLTDVSVLWAIVWLLPGFVIVMNIVGFLTLPLYWLAARMIGPRVSDVLRND